MKFVLSIYDYLRRHKGFTFLLFMALTSFLYYAASTLQYKEDISDFLPLDERNKERLNVYQSVSGADKIFAIVSSRDTLAGDCRERVVETIDKLCSVLEERDTAGYISDITATLEMEKGFEALEVINENLPLFLMERDYERIDSLLSKGSYINEKMKGNKELLLFPSSSMMAENIARDPLSLFTPILSSLSGKEAGIAYDTYEDYIFTPDGSRGIVILSSSSGSRETERNTELVALLDDAKERVEKLFPDMEIVMIGGPAVAVANADRIKKDGMIAGGIAGVLILLLLIYVFRNIRNIGLIFISVGWGMLFALGFIGIYYDSVSIIVIGISSVIIGLALNYPLHFIDHLRECPSKRETIREIAGPLVVGNITTVGAFLCLVPLNSVALHDLGLFASLLLIGTIIFVLIFLPFVAKGTSGKKRESAPKLITALSRISPERSKGVVAVVCVLTVFFALFCGKAEFDSDMRNINYMTPEQRRNMEYFSSLQKQDPDSEKIYLLSSASSREEAFQINERVDAFLEKNLGDSVKGDGPLSRFFPSGEVQQIRINRWKLFVEKWGAQLKSEIKTAAMETGFDEMAFEPFFEVLDSKPLPLSEESMKPVSALLFSRNYSRDTENGKYSLVREIEVSKKNLENTKERLKGVREFGADFFDVASMNGSIAGTLSDDFNYIGVVCGSIVFIFLWLSLGRIELAIISFLPMAVSWIWILGMMGLFGIKFNIVNLILATFIFGQGDDYTIFMTEGLIYEFAYRKRVLQSYKNSIIVSALIMFIGIGTLIFAQHPAMRSLGEVTVVGMLSVVLMASLFPPLVFNWLIKKNGRIRKTPLTLTSLFRGKRSLTDFELVMGRYIYKGMDVERKARKTLRRIRKETLQNNISLDLSSKGRVPEVYEIELEDSQGEMALLLALRNPESMIIARASSSPQKSLVESCAEEFVGNLRVER